MSLESDLSHSDTAEFNEPFPLAAAIAEPAVLEEDTVDTVSQEWADQLEYAEDPSPMLAPPEVVTDQPMPSAEPPIASPMEVQPPVTAMEVQPPAPAPAASAPLTDQAQIVEMVRMQSARLSQLEDVMNRYQLLTDQTMARLECGMSRAETAHKQTCRHIDDLKRARDAVFEELGIDKMNSRVAAPPPQPLQQPFGRRGGFQTERQRMYSPEARYVNHDEGQWVQQSSRRGGRGGRR